MGYRHSAALILMATSTQNINFSNSTEGDYRKWVKSIGDGLLAVGLVRTARTDDGAFAFASSEATGKDATAAFDAQENVQQTTTGTANVQVSAAGDSGSNGTYPPNGSSQGATNYYNQSTYHGISWNNWRAGHWTLYDDDYGRAVYHAPGTAAGGPSGAWFVDEGFPSAAPAPSVAWSGGTGGTSNVASRWRSSATPTGAAPQTLTYFAGEAKQLTSYKVFHSGKDGDIKDWKYQTSDNGTTWVDRDTRAAINVVEGAQAYALTTPVTAPYHRLRVTERRGAVAYCEVIEWILLDGADRLPLPQSKRPTAANQYNYVEEWRFDDAMQEAAPVFFRVNYGAQNYNAGNNYISPAPSILVNVSNAADFGRARNLEVLANGAGNLFVSGSPERLCLNCLNASAISIERTRNADGTQNVTGIVGHSTTTFNQGLRADKSFVVNRSSVLPDELTAWVTPNVPQIPRLDGLKTHLMPVFAFAKELFPPTLNQFVYQSQDLQIDTTFTMSIYGQPHTYRATGIAIASGANERVAMLWE